MGGTASYQNVMPCYKSVASPAFHPTFLLLSLIVLEVYADANIYVVLFCVLFLSHDSPFFLLNEIDIICQVPFNGDEDPYKMGRLRWLDSTLGVDEEVTKPFTNLTVTGTALSYRYFVNSRTL